MRRLPRRPAAARNGRGRSQEAVMTIQESPLACRMSALTAQQQARRRELASRLRPIVDQVVPMADGYALRLPGQDDALMQAMEFINLERRCCPFLKFQLEI